MKKDMKLGIVNSSTLVVKFVGDVDNLVCEPYKNKLETVINENKYKKDYNTNFTNNISNNISYF